MKKQNILVTGGGSLARVLTDILERYGPYKVIGYIAIEPGQMNNRPIYSINSIPKGPRIVLGVLNPIYREEFIEKIGEKRILTVRDGFISPSASLGIGSVSMYGSYIMNEAKIGDFVHVHTTSIIGHNCIIGDNSIISAACITCGNVIIGKKVRLGVGAKIMPYVKVGDMATIGAGAVVLENVPAGVVVAGIPAQQIAETNLSRFQKGSYND